METAAYDAALMRRHECGQVNVTGVFVLLGIAVSAVWIWKRLSVEQQEYFIDQAIPLALMLGTASTGAILLVRALRKRRTRLRRRAALLASFDQESSHDKRLEIAFAVIEVNGYQLRGLESVAPAMKELFTTTMQRALGEKQHRVRGMAASHLGVLQDKSVVPLLVKALEDDHAYVRSCAALGLGRLRAIETREQLMTVMKEDWDQTVRSRAKEALERMGA